MGMDASPLEDTTSGVGGFSPVPYGAKATYAILLPDSVFNYNFWGY